MSIKIYISFGQLHRHVLGGVIFDKDCIAVIEVEGGETGEALASKLFGRKYSTIYSQRTVSKPKFMELFSRGLVEIPKNIEPIDEEKVTYTPDYGTECTNCYQVPTITVVNDQGQQIQHTELCGPCCWGDADTLDPENW